MLGKPMRAAIGGGKAVISSNVRVAAAGASLDVPIGHKDDSWSFPHFDTITVSVTDAPRPNEILVVMAIPSFRLIYYEDRAHNADLTIKATGHQWYWEYTYPDKNNLDFSSYIIPDDQLKAGQLRLLTVDNELVIPVGKNIRVLTTSGDVIHSFFIPALGIQRYAIPGRTIETWMRADTPGTFYGQCNQICGTNHSRMPIVVRAVSDQDFAAWLEQAKTKFSDATPAAPARGSKQRLLAAATEIGH